MRAHKSDTTVFRHSRADVATAMPINSPLKGTLIVFLAIVAAFTAPAAVAQYNFTLITDQASTGLNPVGGVPSVSGSDVTFFANINDPATEGFYRVGPTAVPFTLLQRSTSIPGNSTNFSILRSGPISVDGSSLAFSAFDAAFFQGYYALTDEGFTALAGPGSSLPGPTGNDDLALDGNDAVFTVGNRAAIHALRNGTVSLIADSNTTIPGDTVTFRTFFGVDIDDGTIVFSADHDTGERGIYLDDGTGIVALVESGDPAPGGDGTALFTASIGPPAPVIDGDDVLFVATLDDGRTGLFLSRGFGSLELVVEFDPANPTTLPGGTERADNIRDTSLSDGNAAFVARDASGDVAALFAVKNGVVERVIGTSDVIGGRTVDVVGGSSEMLDGDTLAFFVLFLGDIGAVYRADRGSEPQVSDSGVIVNGSFSGGLANWVPTGTVQVAAGPAVELTSDTDPAVGTAEIAQGISTPNGSYIIFFDYNFTTTTGVLQLLVNGTAIANIQAPTTITPAFNRAEIFVNDPSLMGLAGANFTIRLNPGSPSNASVTGIYIPSYSLPPKQVEVSAQAVFAGNLRDLGLLSFVYLVDGSDQVAPDEADALSQVDAVSTFTFVFAQSGASALSPAFTGQSIVGSRSEWNLDNNTFSTTEARSMATATNHYRVIWTDPGPAPIIPIPVGLALNITGSLDIFMDDGAFDPFQTSAKARAVMHAEVHGASANRVLLDGDIETRFRNGGTPDIFDRVCCSTDIPAPVQGLFALDPVHSESEFAPRGSKTEVIYRATFDDEFRAEVGSIVALELGLGTAALPNTPQKAVDGAVISDFSGTSKGELFSTVPGIVFLPVDTDPEGDEDGDSVTNVLDHCPGTPLGEAVDPDGCAASQDGDADGIPDVRDICPGTAPEVDVDVNGCAAGQLEDDDGDGVPNGQDQCPDTPPGEAVGADGCPLGPMDDDGDGVPNNQDLCPDTPPEAEVDADGCADSQLDEDGDGIANDLDQCPSTVIPESVPTVVLRKNRYALTAQNVPNDTTFESTHKTVFTTVDTGGCSCEQIISQLGLGQGHTRFGCSKSVMQGWRDQVNP